MHLCYQRKNKQTIVYIQPEVYSRKITIFDVSILQEVNGTKIYYIELFLLGLVVSHMGVNIHLMQSDAPKLCTSGTCQSGPIFLERISQVCQSKCPALALGHL
jgi:hypothetical protein